MKLVIVESPTKAKTISKFLGRAFKIKSSFGHIRDLPTKELGVDIKNHYEPKYIIPAKALARVRELKKLAKEAELVILATDEDREGEAISWHLLAALDLEEEKTERIAFHEITKSAIQKAMENPRRVDLNLVNAQQARRVLDRLVGYKLSPLLWKKVRKGLSAGRVQSVAVRLVVEREREIQEFKPQEYWEIESLLKKHPNASEPFVAKLWKKNDKLYKKLDVKDKKQADEIIGALENSKYQVEKITKKEVQKTPPAPFTTSTLQQAAGSYLGYPTKQTMRLAQQLYEGIALEDNQPVGLITYMRTDSVNLSLESVVSAKNKISSMFGKEYALDAPRFYKSKSKGAQEAHEAIRPTFPEKDPESIKQYLTPQQFKLYRLIWNRMIACQMAAARMDSTTVEVSAKRASADDVYHLKANGSVIKFEGYLKLTGSASEDTLLPELSEQEPLDLDKVNSVQKFTQPPSRYTEATLVKALEENGIGRPSTYAPTISTVQDRGYVEKDEQKKLLPTEIGTLVNDMLVENFNSIVDYQFTAQMEEKLDDIAVGKNDWINVVDGFYGPFEETLKEKSAQIQKVQKELGRNCPQCGAELLEKFGRYGKFIACSNYPKCKYTEKSDEEKQQEEEIKKTEGNAQGEILCDKCGAPMVIKKGPYGQFLGCSRYPECKNIKKIEHKLGIPCPKCGKDIVEKRSKKGKSFYGCSGYPNCDFVMWNKPTGEKCPKCKSLLVFGPKGVIKCSSKECDYKKIT